MTDSRLIITRLSIPYPAPYEVLPCSWVLGVVFVEKILGVVYDVSLRFYSFVFFTFLRLLTRCPDDVHGGRGLKGVFHAQLLVGLAGKESADGKVRRKFAFYTPLPDSQNTTILLSLALSSIWFVSQDKSYSMLEVKCVELLHSNGIFGKIGC